MKLPPRIPCGREDSTGFHYDEPSMMDARRSREAARRVLVWGVLAWLALIVWLVWQLAK